MAETQSLKCPKCGGSPVVTYEEDFLGMAARTWSVFHVCPKGFNVDEGPCVSESDAIDAWNYQVGLENEARDHEYERGQIHG